MQKILHNEIETKEFGEKIGSLLLGGEIIELVGDVGAGKTTFVKGLALGLNVDEDVQSPSYTINRVYDGRDGLKLSHYDFYRLNDAGIMANEINETINDPSFVTVIEWSDAIKDVLPDDRLIIKINNASNDSRVFNVTSGGDKSNVIIGGLDSDNSN